MNGRATRIDHDWCPGIVPPNVWADRDVFIDTSYGFAQFGSLLPSGLELGEASGAYDRTNFVVGPEGRISVGPFTCLNGTYFHCFRRITVGSHCFLGWGSVITDSWPGGVAPLGSRRAAMSAASRNPLRLLPTAGEARPVMIEDNVWVGFGAVILPGVTLGTGCVVGCRTVVDRDVPPYVVVAGDPLRVVRHLGETGCDGPARPASPPRSFGSPGD